MDKEFSQMDIVKCKQHPQMVISYIFCKSNCPYPSLFACARCIKEFKTVEGFEEVLEVLNDPRVIMTNIHQPRGIFSLLNNYFSLQEQDPDYFIYSFKQDIMQLIQKLEDDLKEGIEKYKKFRAEITKVHQQFNEALGRDKLRQAFKDILKVENYHDSQEWKQFEETVKNFIFQFEEQKNQELNEAYYKLKQIEQTLQPQLLNDFKENVSKSMELLCRRFAGTKVASSSSLCDRKYFEELIQRVKGIKTEEPRITLLFKASEHGMNSQAFWEKCSNQGPTITICQSKNGTVFGGYTPCKWIPSVNAYQKDESKTSFLFSYTRKEIYPLLSVNHAIFCNNSYGPTFGGGFNLNISTDFQSGYSNMMGRFYSNESYKVQNQKTHLMGSETPQLMEMEVFLID